MWSKMASLCPACVNSCIKINRPPFENALKREYSVPCTPGCSRSLTLAGDGQKLLYISFLPASLMSWTILSFLCLSHLIELGSYFSTAVALKEYIYSPVTQHWKQRWKISHRFQGRFEPRIYSLYHNVYGHELKREGSCKHNSQHPEQHQGVYLVFHFYGHRWATPCFLGAKLSASDRGCSQVERDLEAN